MSFFSDYLKDISGHIQTVEMNQLESAVGMIRDCNQKKGKVIVAGNGGSAALASHVTVDLTKNAGVRAINFNEADMITCFANDFGYENWLTKALEFYADPQDLVVLVSSSGKSPNMINAANACNRLNLKLLTFSGFDPENPLRTKGNLNFWVASKEYNFVEMTHHIWLLAIVDKLIEEIR